MTPGSAHSFVMSAISKVTCTSITSVISTLPAICLHVPSAKQGYMNSPFKVLISVQWSDCNHKFYSTKAEGRRAHLVAILAAKARSSAVVTMLTLRSTPWTKAPYLEAM